MCWASKGQENGTEQHYITLLCGFHSLTYLHQRKTGRVAVQLRFLLLVVPLWFRGRKVRRRF